VVVGPEITAALPDYEVERELGRGGMGVVFLGRHQRLGRRVAIKELPSSFAADPNVRERFSTEARTLATLAHPHIVPIYDYVERDGLCLIVMEELPGGTVWDRFTTTGLTPPTACAIVLACCAALQHAHDKGVLHLDVKPDNLMFADNSAIKVTDFGISRVISGDRTLGTLDGQVLGTPAYMSPEQARGSELTQASDVYSAGVMLYELLSGHLPWVGAETATELLLKRLREDPRPLRTIAPQVPQSLADVVMKAIEREPEDRYASAEDFGVAIASACAEAWGPDWLDRAGVAIIGSDRLTVAARTTGRRPVVDDAAAVTTAGTGRAASATVTGEALPDEAIAGTEHASQTVVSGPVGGGAPAAAAAAAPAAPPPDLEFQVVRAAGSEPRIEGANLNVIERSAFVDVSELVAQPTSIRIPLLVTLGLFAAALVSALVLFSPPEREGPLKARQVTLGRSDVGRAGTVSFDLDEDLPVRSRVTGPGAFANRAVLRFSAAGIPLGETSARLDGGKGVMKTNALRHLATGSVEGTLELRADDKVLVRQEFPAKIATPWYLTVFGVGGVLVILAGFAYLESSLRPLRRARRRILSFAGCAISSAVMGAGVIGFIAATGNANPTRNGGITVLALCAVAGIALGVTVRRAALRRGIKRAVKRAERAYAAPAA
jgi:serine/threonine-protein kinase